MHTNGSHRQEIGVNSFAQEALRLFPSQEKDGKPANHTDSNEESYYNTVHASSSFLRSSAIVCHTLVDLSIQSMGHHV